jgi:hypothetical protein
MTKISAGTPLASLLNLEVDAGALRRGGAGKLKFI